MICTGVTLFVLVLRFCTGVTLFALVLHLNCTALSQSESSNFFMYIINYVITEIEVVTGKSQTEALPY